MPEIIEKLHMFAAFAADCMMLSLIIPHDFNSTPIGMNTIRWLREWQYDRVADGMAFARHDCGYLIQPSDWKSRTACILLFLIYLSQ